MTFTLVRKSSASAAVRLANLLVGILGTAVDSTIPPACRESNACASHACVAACGVAVYSSIAH